MWTASRAWTGYGSAIVALGLVLGLSSVTLRSVPVAAGVAVATSVGLELLVVWARGRPRWKLPYGALVTGLVLGTVVPQTMPAIAVVAAAGLAVAAKHLLRTVRGPLLNPAAVGLILPLGVMHLPADSWAAAAAGFPWTLVVVLPLFVTVSTARRLAAAGTFAVSFVILSVVLSGYVHGYSVAWAGTLVASGFYAIAILMVADPRTSPRDGPTQPAWGASLALLTFGLSAAGLAAPFLYALLLGNLTTAVLDGRGPVLRRLLGGLVGPGRGPASSPGTSTGETSVLATRVP